MDHTTADHKGGAAAAAQHSHPGEAVRHSYPLSIRDASLTTAAGLLMRTMPYALARFGVLLAVTLASIVWTAITLGGAFFLGEKAHPALGYLWFFMLAGAAGYLWRTAVRYSLYVLKAGHIAVLTELITRGRIGDDDTQGGSGMFAYGKRVVTARFGQVNAMFALDLLVHGVVLALNRSLNFIASLLPIPGLSNLTAVLNTVVRASATYVDETILSYSLARGDNDNFRSSRDGLIYYAQNSKEVLKTGVFIVVLDKVATFAIWLVMLAPAFGLAWLMPGSTFTLVAFFFAWLLASNVRSAFMEPLFLIMVMVKFHHSVEGQAIDLEWDGRLGQLSDKFMQLKDRMAGADPAQGELRTQTTAG